MGGPKGTAMAVAVVTSSGVLACYMYTRLLSTPPPLDIICFAHAIGDDDDHRIPTTVPMLSLFSSTHYYRNGLEVTAPTPPPLPTPHRHYTVTPDAPQSLPHPISAGIAVLLLVSSEGVVDDRDVIGLPTSLLACLLVVLIPKS